MRTVRVVLVLLVGDGLSGCTPSHAALSAGGANVQALSAVQAGPVANCQFLGPVQAQFGGNFVSQEENQQNAMIELRNQAAALGATHVVLDNAELAERDALNRDNHVRQTGNAYRCPPGGVVAPATAPVATAPTPTTQGPATAAPESGLADATNSGPTAEVPTREQIAAAMTRVRPALQSCDAAWTGTATLRVTFAGETGAVTDASATGDLAGTPVGACMAGAVRSASVPPFRLSSLTVTFPFVFP